MGMGSLKKGKKLASSEGQVGIPGQCNPPAFNSTPALNLTTRQQEQLRNIFNIRMHNNSWQQKGH